MHGGDEGADVAPFGFGAGKAVLGGPGAPGEVGLLARSSGGLVSFCGRGVVYHFSRSALISSLSPSGLCITPSTSPSILCL